QTARPPVRTAASVEHHEIEQRRFGHDIFDLVFLIEDQLELTEAVTPETQHVGVQLRVLAAHRIADRHEGLFAGHAACYPRTFYCLPYPGRKARHPNARILGHDVAPGEGRQINVAAVVVADCLPAAIDIDMD